MFFGSHADHVQNSDIRALQERVTELEFKVSLLTIKLESALEKIMQIEDVVTSQAERDDEPAATSRKTSGRNISG